MTSKSTWKKLERDVANELGTRRTPLSGGASGHTRSDTLHDGLFIECKKSSKNFFLSKTRKEWENARILARFENKTPVLVLSKLGENVNDARVIMNFNDFKKIAWSLNDE